MASVKSLTGFDPVVRSDCRAVVLGSFPSAASLQAGHYYAHPRNQFWPIIGDIIGRGLVTLSFEQRYQALMASKLGLWDVIAQCERPGSLDSDIRNETASQLDHLLELAPKVRALLLNGRKAQAGARRVNWGDVELIDLPSTSPAYAGMPMQDKLSRWRDAVHRIMD